MAAPTQPLEPFVGLYTMYYRFDTNFLKTKNFRHHGDLRSARERADKHCRIMGYKLNFVQPMISDLETEEKYKLGDKTAMDSVFTNAAGEMKK